MQTFRKKNRKTKKTEIEPDSGQRDRQSDTPTDEHTETK